MEWGAFIKTYTSNLKSSIIIIVEDFWHLIPLTPAILLRVCCSFHLSVQTKNENKD